MTNQISFHDLGLSDDITENLVHLGFENPTEIQTHAIPELLSGDRDILGLAQTGTGKTAGFSLPIIESIGSTQSKNTKALIIAPTRELAKQITTEIQRLKANRPINTTTVYGGSPIGDQIRSIKRGSPIVVGTPGRLLDLIRREVLDLSEISHVVLDEADEMLSMGFIEDIETIMEATPKDKTTLLFSATMPKRLKSLADKYLRNKLEINLRKKEQTPSLTTEIYHEVFGRDKKEALRRIIDSEKDFYGIVFANTRADVDEAAKKLQSFGYSVEALHGEIPQSRREITISKFRRKDINILVATDVAARGVDIKGLTHVVNIDLPSNPETYIHRVGRTGRAGSSGKAINLVSPKEARYFQLIKGTAKGEIKKVALPTPHEVVQAQRSMVIEELRSLSRGEECGPNTPLVKELLKQDSPDMVISALLKIAYGSKLEESSYPDLAAPKPIWLKDRQQHRKGGMGRNKGGGKGRFSNQRSRRGSRKARP